MKNKVEYYLAKGFDLKMAEYFADGRRKIVNVIPNDDFSLTLTFDNGEIRCLYVANMLKRGTVFEPLSKWQNFKRVYLDENSCVSWDIAPDIDSSKVWSNKVDLSPDACYVDSIPVKSV